MLMFYFHVWIKQISVVVGFFTVTDFVAAIYFTCYNAYIIFLATMTRWWLR